MRHGYIHALKLHKVYALVIYIHSNYIKYTPWLYTCTQTTSSIRLGYIHALKLHKVYALVIYMHSNYIKYTPSLYTYTQTT